MIRLGRTRPRDSDQREAALPPSTDPRLERRHNNFGVLRLVLALLVIISHASEMVSGNPQQEILMRLFGTVSLGAIAVDGFFVISGFLITKSFVEHPSAAAFLVRRVFRIAPAYLVCFFLCALVLAPLVGAPSPLLSGRTMARLAFQAARLLQPEVPGAFPGMPFSHLNVSMWTIAFEFRCYLAVAALGALGLVGMSSRRWLLVGALACVALNAIGVPAHPIGLGEGLTGSFDQDIRFAALFGTGASYYLYKDMIPLTGKGAALATAGFVAALASSRWATSAVDLFGAYLLVWFALRVRLGRLHEVGTRVDISYGTYLYAWPIQNLLIWSDRAVGPWCLAIEGVLLASVCGVVSWMLIERPAIRTAARWNARWQAHRISALG